MKGKSMKAKLVGNSIVFIFCLITFASSVAAQTKVDEYTEKPVNLEALALMANRFADRFAAEPAATRGFVNLYENTTEAEKIKSVLSANREFKHKLVFLQPGIRYMEVFSSIEFWIVRADDDEPYTPGCGLCECPILSVVGAEFFDFQRNRLTFTANVDGSGDNDTVTYQWKVSAGKIIAGQGTSVIKVETEGAQEITATVEIGGVCEDCSREESFTSKIQ